MAALDGVRRRTLLVAGAPVCIPVLPVVNMKRDMAAASFSSGADDRSLFERLRYRDSRAYEELVRVHGGRLLQTARRILSVEEDARDAVQDAFVSAFRGIGSFREECSVGTWLRTIVVNECLMRLRTRSRHPEADIDELLPHFKPDGHGMQPVQEWEISADEALERRELCELVRSSIAKLPESYRLVLLLRDIEEMTTQETAEALGITPNAVKVRLHRARQALRTMLDPSMRSAE